MSNKKVYAIQYTNHLQTAGEFLLAFINKHKGFGNYIEDRTLTWNTDTKTFKEYSCWFNSNKIVYNTSPNSHTLLDDFTLVMPYKNNLITNSNVNTIVIPYVNKHFRERMIKGWNHLKGFDVKVATYEFNKQYRMLNDYVFNIGSNHGNVYKTFSHNYPSVRLEFIDIGMILMYKEREYSKLCKALSIEPLDATVWKNYVNQYRVTVSIS
jgi:hypothetical protein